MGVRLAVPVLCLVLMAACGGESDRGSAAPSSDSSIGSSTTPVPTSSDSAAAPTTAPTTAPSPSGKPGTRIVAGNSKFGTMLYDDTGQAIYLFDVETTTTPRCYGECAMAWPPVITDGRPVAGDGVDAALLGTTERSDGRLQVTYKEHPLYFYAHEDKYEVLCHDVFLNGGNWYVVRPNGDAAPPGS